MEISPAAPVLYAFSSNQEVTDIMKRMILALELGAAVCAALVIGVSTMHAQDAPAASGEGVAVLDTYTLMELLFAPPQEKLKELMATEPADRRAWNTVKDQVGMLAEVSNLVSLRDELDYEKTEEWDQLAAKSREAAVALLEPVKAADYSASMEKYIALIESCNACHTRFEPEVAPKLVP